MKQVWKFGHTLALNLLEGTAHEYTEKNGVLYIVRPSLLVPGIFVHIHRQLKEYYTGRDTNSLNMNDLDLMLETTVRTNSWEYPNYMANRT